MGPIAGGPWVPGVPAQPLGCGRGSPGRPRAGCAITLVACRCSPRQEGTCILLVESALDYWASVFIIVIVESVLDYWPAPWDYCWLQVFA